MNSTDLWDLIMLAGGLVGIPVAVVTWVALGRLVFIRGRRAIRAERARLRDAGLSVPEDTTSIYVART